ncbi:MULTISPECIES: hypothetical protein [unclassified Fibrobacter]|uniref:hypothetical protein n=1 Tax=unclassified Fibrobacter TaxID=2634177 RepID=UPI000D6DA3D3|nr:MULTISPECIES: hypothetical protein [unclassified Fibrobacter]PWJ69043.1 hypothetical protein BGX12_1056 [Fibrobacter sp. UWR4]PZW72874.1 hypothetical protein C8E88_10056 [Fibrobacter sp. UWR1]
MKKITKWFTLALAACGAFVGCGDNGGSPSYNMEDSFDIVLSKSSYVYKSKDSLLIVKPSVCKEVKEGGLRYLQWKKESSNPDTLFAYREKSRAYIRDEDDEDEKVYTYSGSSFPNGNWTRVDDARNSIHNALVFSSGVMKETFQYDGACFMKSFYTQMFDKNKSLESAEKAISKFYEMFRDDDDDEIEENDIVEDMRVPDCDELSMKNGEVTIRVNTLKASSGKITLNYRGETCLIKFNLRYANKESDCKAAYDEYKLNRNTDKDFNFEDYDRTLDYSYNCIADLVKKLKKDEANVNSVASSAVDVILSGLR